MNLADISQVIAEQHIEFVRFEQFRDAGITGKISFGDSNVPQKGVTFIAIKDGKFTLGAEVVPEKVPAP